MQLLYVRIAGRCWRFLVIVAVIPVKRPVGFAADVECLAVGRRMIVVFGDDDRQTTFRRWDERTTRINLVGVADNWTYFRHLSWKSPRGNKRDKQDPKDHFENSTDHNNIGLHQQPAAPFDDCFMNAHCHWRTSLLFWKTVPRTFSKRSTSIVRRLLVFLLLAS